MREFDLGVLVSAKAVGYGRIWVQIHTAEELRQLQVRMMRLPDDAFPKPFTDFVAKAGKGVLVSLASYFRAGVDEMTIKTRAERRAAERRFRKRTRQVNRDWTPRVIVRSARIHAGLASVQLDVLEGRHEGARMSHALKEKEVAWILEKNEAQELVGCRFRTYVLSRRAGGSVFASGVYELVWTADGPMPRRVEFWDCGVERDPSRGVR